MFAEFLLERFSKFPGELFRSGHQELDAGKLFGFSTLQVSSQKRRSRHQQRDLISLDHLSVFNHVDRSGIGYGAYPANHWVPQRHRAAKTMKERKGCHDGIFAPKIQHGAKLLNVSQYVPVT